MLWLSARTGFGFVVFFVAIGVLQMQPVTDALLAFIIVGLIPGIGLQVPADATLVITGGLLMAISVLISRQYVLNRLALAAAMRKYASANSVDESQKLNLKAIRLSDLQIPKMSPRDFRLSDLKKSASAVWALLRAGGRSAKYLCAWVYARAKSVLNPAKALLFVQLTWLDLRRVGAGFGERLSNFSLRRNVPRIDFANISFRARLASAHKAARSFSFAGIGAHVRKASEWLDAVAERAHNYLISQMFRLFR